MLYYKNINKSIGEQMARNPEKTRQRLLQAAYEEIHAHGFQGMRVDQVLRKTSLQKGAFYHHFSSKLELGMRCWKSKSNLCWKQFG